MLILLGVAIFCSSCQKCSRSDFYLRVSFTDSTFQTINPIFDRVYGIGAEGNYVENASVDSIPINMSSDSTFFMFELNGEIDTVAFSYNRESNVGGNRKGYCVRLMNEKILELTTFNNALIIFESALNSSNDEYSLHLRY